MSTPLRHLLGLLIIAVPRPASAQASAQISKAQAAYEALDYLGAVQAARQALREAPSARTGDRVRAARLRLRRARFDAPGCGRLRAAHLPRAGPPARRRTGLSADHVAVCVGAGTGAGGASGGGGFDVLHRRFGQPPDLVRGVARRPDVRSGDRPGHRHGDRFPDRDRRTWTELLERARARPPPTLPRRLRGHRHRAGGWTQRVRLATPSSPARARPSRHRGSAHAAAGI